MASRRVSPSRRGGVVVAVGADVLRAQGGVQRFFKPFVPALAVLIPAGWLFGRHASRSWRAMARYWRVKGVSAGYSPRSSLTLGR